MDAKAIKFVSDNVLKRDYGIIAPGDIFALRSFCEDIVKEEKDKHQQYEEKTKELIDQLMNGKNERKKIGKNGGKPPQRRTTGMASMSESIPTAKANFKRKTR